MNLKNRQAGWKRQKGMTLMELLVAGSISVVVSSAMVILMASTLGTGTRTIKVTQLGNELRAAMQIMSRELRRANYHANFATCFGDQDCLVTLGYDSNVTEININAGQDCFWFWYDRQQRCPTSTCTTAQLAAAQTAVTGETVAAFRRTANGDGIGIMQMTTAATAASCTSDTGWVNITDPDFVDVQAFNVNDAVTTDLASYQFTSIGTQSIERIGLTMTGTLISDDASMPVWMQGGSTPTLTVRDFIRVRNDVARP